MSTLRKPALVTRALARATLGDGREPRFARGGAAEEGVRIGGELRVPSDVLGEPVGRRVRGALGLLVDGRADVVDRSARLTLPVR